MGFFSGSIGAPIGRCIIQVGLSGGFCYCGTFCTLCMQSVGRIRCMC